MKKIIAFLLVLTLSLGLLAGCAPADNTTAGPTLAEAVDALTTSYSGDEGKMTPADYKLVSRIVVRTVAFEVTWAASLDTIQITKTEDGKYWIVDVPSKNETQVEYTLTATVKDADGKTETKTFTRVLPVYDDAGIVSEPVEGQAYKFFMVHANLGKTLFATTATQKSNNQDKYIKTDIDPKKGADFYAEKVEGGYKFYTTIDGNKMYMHAFLVENADGTFSKHIGYAAESDCVYVYNKELKTWFVTLNNYDYGVGTYGTYDTVCISENTHFTADAIGVKQFTLNLMAKEAAEALAPTEGPADPTELTSITDFNAIASALEDKGAGTVEKYLVKGVIVEIKSTQYGNMYIQDEAGNKLYVYGLYSKDGETRFDAMDPQPKVGDTVTLMGIACNYNGAQMKNAWLQELIPGEGGNEGGDDETTNMVPQIVETFEIGKPYKFGYFSTELNVYHYPTNAMDGFYIACTANAAEAPDIYVEAVEGGYRLYMLDGDKKIYIDAEKSGNYNNIKLNETPKAVYTWDAEYKTFVTDLEGTKLFLGSRGTFTTLSLSDYEKYVTANYVAHLYVMVPGEGGEEGGETTKPADGSTLTIPAFNEIAAAQPDKGDTTTEKYVVSGVIVEIKSTKFGNMYIQDEAGNKLYVYGVYAADGTTRYDALEVKPQVGDYITLLGAAGNYNGAQMKNGAIQAHKAPTTIPAFNEIAAAQPDKGDATADKYLVTGEITEIKSDKYGNMYIKDADGNTMYIYGLYSADGETRYDSMTTKPAVGDTITVLGVASNYNGAQMKSAWLLLHTPAAGGEEGGEAGGETLTAETGKLNVVLGEDKQYIVALDGGWVTATTTASEAGAVVIEFNADKTQAKIKVGGKYIAPSGGNKNGIKEGEYVWAVVKNADGTYRFMGQGSDTVTLAFNTDSEYMKFRAYKNETIEKAPDAYPCDFTFTTK